MNLHNENIGPVDRAVRAILGIILLAAFLWGITNPSYAFIVALVGVLLLMTAITQRCLLYALLGINTGAKAAKKAAPIKGAKKKARSRKRRRKK